MVTAGRGRTCTRAGLFGGFTDRLFYLGFVGLGDGFVQAELLQHVLGVEQLGEGLVGDDVELVDLPHTRIPAERQPQPAPHRLLSEHLRSHRPQRHDDRDVLDIPAFLELVHAHHRQHGRAGQVQLVQAALRQLVLMFGVHLQHCLVTPEIFRGTQKLRYLGSVFHVRTHDEHHGVNVSTVFTGGISIIVGLFDRPQLQSIPQLLFLRGLVRAIPTLTESQHRGFDVFVLDRPIQRILIDHVIGFLIHRSSKPNRRRRIQFS